MLAASINDEDDTRDPTELVKETSKGKFWLGKIPLHPYEEETMNERKRIQKARHLITSIDNFLETDINQSSSHNNDDDQLELSEINEEKSHIAAIQGKSSQERNVSDQDVGTVDASITQQRMMREQESKTILNIVFQIARTVQEWLPFLPIEVVATSAFTLVDKVQNGFRPRSTELRSRLITLREELSAMLRAAGNEGDEYDELPYDLLNLPFVPPGAMVAADPSIPDPPPPPPLPPQLLSMSINPTTLPPKPTGPHRSPTTPNPTPTTPSFTGFSTETIKQPEKSFQPSNLPSRLPSILKDTLKQGVQLKHVPRTPSGNIKRRRPSPAIVTPEDYLFKALKSKFRNAHDDENSGNLRRGNSSNMNSLQDEESDEGGSSAPSRRTFSGSSTSGLSAIGITAGNCFKPPSDSEDDDGYSDEENETEEDRVLALQKKYNEPLPSDDLPLVEIFDPSLEVIQEEPSVEDADATVANHDTTLDVETIGHEVPTEPHIRPSEAALMA